MTFADVIGQQEVKDRLLQMVAENRLPHAMLFCGPQGCGKMALALAFASYLLCSNHEGKDDACGECKQCKMVAKWEHPDLHFTFPTIKLSSMGADHKPVSDDFAAQWRSLLQRGPYFTMDQWLTEIGAENQQAIITAGESDDLVSKLSLKSSQGGYKISVIWLPERMNTECANKLLKLIEEPPLQTVFILVSEEPTQLLETIRSRTQRIDVKRIDTDSIVRSLVCLRGLDDDTAHRVARSANGSWTEALKSLEVGNENDKFFEQFQYIMRASYGRRVKDMKTWSDVMAGFGRERQRRYLNYMLHLLRENFMYNFHNSELTYMTFKEEEFAKKFAPFVNEGNILQLYDLVNRSKRDIGQNANAKIVFFDMALRLTVLLIPRKK